MRHALRVSHLMLRLMYQDLEVLVPLGIQVVVDDLALRHVLLPHSHSAHAHSSTSNGHFRVCQKSGISGVSGYAQGSIQFHSVMGGSGRATCKTYTQRQVTMTRHAATAAPDVTVSLREGVCPGQMLRL